MSNAPDQPGSGRPDRPQPHQPPLTGAEQPRPPDGTQLSKAERLRRRAAVFGDVLPETTTDERGETAGDAASGGASDASDAFDASDEWLRQQVPPHHA